MYVSSFFMLGSISLRFVPPRRGDSRDNAWRLDLIRGGVKVTAASFSLIQHWALCRSRRTPFTPFESDGLKRIN